MTTVLLTIHLFVTLALIGVVLIQRSEGGGLGIGTSQGMGSFMSGRGTANLLTRTTGILAAGFFVTSLFLGWWAGYEHKASNIIFPGTTPASQTGTPLAPPTSGGLLDSLKKADQPQAPQAPAGPQAPQSR